MDIYFYEAFQHEAEALKSMLGNEFTYDFSSGTIQEAGHSKPPARLISVRTQSLIPLEWSEKLEGILSRSTGYDHLISYSSNIKRALPLGYLEEYATRAVAEHAIMLTMALLRRLPKQISQFPSFDREDLTGSECRGKNMLVVGVGRIGSEVVKIGQQLGFEVKGVDIVPNKPNVVYVSWQDGISWADVIVCAMNLTAVNRGYFNYDLMRGAKKAIIFINIARGELSPLADLERLLREGRLGGVGLDVFEDEGNLAVALRNPTRQTVPQAVLVNRILMYPNVLLTPHNAFNSTEALQRKSAKTAEQIRYFFKHHDFLWKV